MHKIQRAIVAVAAAGGLAFASSASAQVGFTPLNQDPKAANAAFPLQNPLGPSGTDYQVNYPYPGQCLASDASKALFPTLQTCTATASSFACEAGAGVSQRSAGGWAGCGTLYPFQTLLPVVPGPAAPGVPATPKFVWEVLNPPDYTPDTTMYSGADYYEIGLHEATGFQGLANAGLFPNPRTGPAVPNGMQWTGLICNIPGGCACPADASASFKTTYCSSATGKIPVGNPLFTPIWGVGQINMGGGPVTGVLSNIGKCAVTVAKTCVAGAVAPSPFACPLVAGTTTPETCNVFNPPWFDNKTATPSPWSANNYVATWPSISIRGTTGRPVVVKWTNEFPNTHVLCPHPDAADWPCAIDRTFMGVKATIDHALAGDPLTAVPPDGVNQYGSPQQPDNSWVTHLHGGEIPPSTDGFAMKWFGNSVTAARYDGIGKNYSMPPFENPSNIALKRPHGNSDIYAYPMIQEEATIWFHDHSIGKTHHNVIAGPAGFFPVKDPDKHGSIPAAWRWIGDGARQLPATSAYTWLDPLTEPRDALGIPKYDLFLAVQDRAFNEDGSINFSNGLGQTPLPPPAQGGLGVTGQTPVTAGVNPLVHPVWVPEYFGDHALVNGVIWPKKTVETGWYRLRVVNGSDSRCYTSGFMSRKIGQAALAPNTNLAGNMWFYILANDQGYVQRPVKTKTFTMCPGERYEILIDFGNLNGNTAYTDGTVYMVNSAPAPFPAGFPPFAGALGPSPWPDMNLIMRFDVRAGTAANGLGKGVRGCGMAGAPLFMTWIKGAPLATNMATACMPKQPEKVLDVNFVRITGPAPANKPNIIRQVYLNEKVDGVTLLPLGMQLNGVPFEYKVTETPNFGTREVWKFVNLTVDTHPMHPHLVRHQIVNRQGLDVMGFKADLCGDPTCQPGPAPGNEMQVIPNVDGLSALGLPFLVGLPVAPAPTESGWKDVVQVPPAMVTTIVADWTPRWNGAAAGIGTNPVLTTTAPGTVNNPINPLAAPGACPTQSCPATSLAAPWVYEGVITGPYVWHCHINSHEDSEMMRTSLVVP